MNFRVVFDESSVDFTEMEPAGCNLGEQIEGYLDRLADTLFEMRARGTVVGRSPLGYGVECWPGVPFDAFLGTMPLPAESGIHHVDREVRRRCNSLLDKCPEWDIGERAELDVFIGGRSLFAPSVAYTHACELQGNRTSCLVFGGCARRGEVIVDVASVAASVWFLANAEEFPLFLRTCFKAEDVSEKEFFPLAFDAFPQLRFSEDLNFGRLDGAYRDVREDVVTTLAAINDHFLALMRQHAGQPHLVESGLRSLGCNASPESPKTRSSDKLMKLREVSFQGKMVRCEWHAKLERHRNRIHFAPLTMAWS